MNAIEIFYLTTLCLSFCTIYVLIKDKRNLSLQHERALHDVKSPLIVLSHLLHRNKLSLDSEIIEGTLLKISNIINNNDGVQGSFSEKDLINLNELLDSLSLSKKVEFIKNKVALYTEMPSEALYSKGNKEELTRVLSNIINNSKEAFSSAIDIQLIKDTKFNKIIITDNGIGINKDKLKLIFRHGITLNKKGGKGVGLSSAKKHITSLGGEISLRSKSSMGTEVTICLPIVK